MANDGTVKIGTQLDDSGFKSGLSKLGSVASTALKGGVAIIGGVATAASGAVAGLLALEGATEEYRVAQGKLNSAFEAAGSDANMAAYTYSEFYKILGDTDTATEASQLMAQLSTNGEDIAYWTHIAAGAYASFGDALPIEGLIEAANETVKVGQVTGTLADALNWVGISEDEVNKKLAEFDTEAERSEYLMNLLMDAYDGAADSFWEGNEALVAAREAQIQMDDALSKLGSAVSDVKSRLTAEFMPAIVDVTEGLAGMLSGTEGAEEQFSEGIGSIIDSAVEMLPEFLDLGVQIISSLIEGLVENIPNLIAAVPQIVSSFTGAFSNMFSTISQTGGNMLMELSEGIRVKLPEFARKLPEIVRSFVSFIQQNLPTIIEQGGEIISNLAAGIGEAIPSILGAALELGVGLIIEAFTNIPGIIEAGVSIVTNLVSGIVSAIPQLLDSVANIAAQVAEAFIPGSGEKVIQGWENVKSYFASAVEYIKGVWANVAPYFEAVWGSIQNAFSAVVSYFQTLFTKAWEVITAVWDKVEPYFSAIWEAIQGIFSVVSDVLGEYFSLAFETIKSIWSVASDFFQTIFDTIAGIFSAAESILSGDFEGAWEAIKGVFSGWGDFFSGLIDTIASVFSNAFSMFVDIGKNIVEGIWDGISGMGEWLASNVTSFFDGIVGGVTSFLGIHSPSTLFRDKVGKNIGLGVAEGIESSIPAATESAKNMASSLIDAMPSATMRVSAANASMAPATPQMFGAEAAITRAAGMLAMANSGGGGEVILQIDGTEMGRIMVPFIRNVESQSPVIVSNQR